MLLQLHNFCSFSPRSYFFAPRHFHGSLITDSGLNTMQKEDFWTAFFIVDAVEMSKKVMLWGESIKNQYCNFIFTLAAYYKLFKCDFVIRTTGGGITFFSTPYMHSGIIKNLPQKAWFTIEVWCSGINVELDTILIWFLRHWIILNLIVCHEHKQETLVSNFMRDYNCPTPSVHSNH